MNDETGSRALLEVHGLTVRFDDSRRLGRNRRPDNVLDQVDLVLGRGEILGLVGSSGGGKSTLAKALVRLIEPSEGMITFDGIDITHAPERALRPIRRRMQMIFQDPGASLDPRATVHQMLAEALRVHHVVPKAEGVREVHRLLDSVGLGSDIGRRYPHELSGGQRQRVSIARAISLRPELLIADEPVSALDSSMRAQILNLLVDLRRDLSLSILLIAHDLSLVQHAADRVAVLASGRIVETLSVDRLDDATHPFTERLLACRPGKRSS